MRKPNKYGIQLRFDVRGPEPTRAFIERTGREWIRTGECPPNVSITPIYWGPTPGKLREWLRDSNVYFGCPGIVKRYAEPGVTMCDYDGGKPPTLHDVWRIAGRLQIRPEWVEYDRTRRGWHLTVKWNRTFTPGETVALQAILGSDPGRETFNLLRVLSGKASRNPRWNLLFERKLK